MKFGADFFKILNLVVQILRLFSKAFGDDEDKKQANDSEHRSADATTDAC